MKIGQKKGGQRKVKMPLLLAVNTKESSLKTSGKGYSKSALFPSDQPIYLPNLFDAHNAVLFIIMEHQNAPPIALCSADVAGRQVLEEFKRIVTESQFLRSKMNIEREHAKEPLLEEKKRLEASINKCVKYPANITDNLMKDLNYCKCSLKS